MSLRGRIALGLISVVAAHGGVMAVVGGYMLQRNVQKEAENRVRQDLNAAQAFYDQRLRAIGDALRYTALGARFSQAVADRDTGYLSIRLKMVREGAQTDLLCVTDGTGQVIHRSHNPSLTGGAIAADGLVDKVLGGAGPITGTVLVPLSVLQREVPSLVERSRVRFVPTPRARPRPDTELDAALMLCAAAPVYGSEGDLVGVLLGAVLLSGDYTLVDQIRNTVFRDERYGGKMLGTATLFQDDVRISTNVLGKDGTRAVGSRVSAEVYERVLKRERTWIGTAWVVNDWYISAYAPIHDVDGRAVGMLYVGVLQRKYRDLTVRTLALFGIVTVTGFGVAALVVWRLADSISRPVRSLASASAAIAAGHFAQQLPVQSEDAIGSLTRTFNRMARSLRERDALLKEQTRLQLTRSERLAAIGRLAAGVAHEINNPLTGVLTFAHMLLKSTPEDSPERRDVETVIEATMRCRDIVRGLLNFSRQNAPRKVPADLNHVLRQALDLTHNQANIRGIKVTADLDELLAHLVIDPNQIQEVVVNIIVNAMDAMPEGGELTVRSRPARENGAGWAEFSVTDTGMGIPPERLERVFDPFFTTKRVGEGTGLGLAVSHGIVTEHGGQIDISSDVARGTTVTVRLPGGREELADDGNAADSGD